MCAFGKETGEKQVLTNGLQRALYSASLANSRVVSTSTPVESHVSTNGVQRRRRSGTFQLGWALDFWLFRGNRSALVDFALGVVDTYA